eukprot:3729999-Amphidinium_carterae.1
MPLIDLDAMQTDADYFKYSLKTTIPARARCSVLFCFDKMAIQWMDYRFDSCDGCYLLPLPG